MKPLFSIICFSLIIFGCGRNFRQGKKVPSFNRSHYIVKTKNSGKFVDYYLNIKEHGYFEYYEKLFGISTSTYYNGVYKIRDTILLMCDEKKFDSTKISHVCFIDTFENKVLFVKKNDNYIEHFGVVKGELKKLFKK